MNRAFSPEAADAFQRDGVVLIRGAFGPEWLSRLRAIVDSILEEPGLWTSDTGDQGRGAGRSLDARYLWRGNEAVRSFVFDSGVADLVGQAMGCEELRFISTTGSSRSLVRRRRRRGIRTFPTGHSPANR